MKYRTVALTFTVFISSMTGAIAEQKLYVGIAGDPAAAIGISMSNGRLTTRISGPKTGIAGWATLADAAGKIYVVSPGGYHGNNSGKISVFASGGNGNIAPIYEITCGSLNRAWDAEVDSAGNLFVTRMGGVSIFAPGARGCVHVHRSIEGPATQLTEPTGIALDANNNVYVSDQSGEVAVFSASSAGNSTPIRIIKGSKTGFSGPEGVAVDGAGYVYVTNYNTNTVGIFAPSQHGNVAPVRSIGGSRTLLNVPVGIRVASDGKVYVSNYGGNITVYARSANGNAAPIGQITMSFPFELHLAK